MLNVYLIRLRFISARLLASVASISKGLRQAHLRRHTAKKYPQRIIDTPAVLFCLIPCICIVYFKRLTEGASTVLLRTN